MKSDQNRDKRDYCVLTNAGESENKARRPRNSAFVLFKVTANYLFSKYRLRALIIKIPTFHRPLLN